MNYDKQKPLTKEEIDYINSKNNLHVVNIPNYPDGFIHVKIMWDLPINITRNEDEVFINDTESNKENYWVVYLDSEYCDYNFELEPKQFKNVDVALKYAIGEYKKWLIHMLKYVEKINV